MGKYKIGDKVIPISKSTGCSFKNSIWQYRGKRTQPYLQINEIKNSGIHICDFTPYGGDFFKEEDLIPFTQSRTELNNHLLNGIIDIDTYQSLIKEVE